ncbi:MAG: PBP1A family penicillin-binding protein [Candidatus Paceibacterota bacterium]|jgi:1A family penicillin-binding protein
MKRSRSWLKRVIRLILVVGVVFFLLGGFSTIWAITLPIPDFETFFDQQIAEQSTKIYDRTGEILLYDVRGVRQSTVPFEEIPSSVKLATLAIEDADFYQHGGIQPSAIVRAFWVNLTSGEIRQGGSTITQQVVKNSLLTKDKTLTRKIKEAVLSLKLEKTMTKDEILNVYLNQTLYGGNIYGVQEAARAYFKKDIKNITLAEAAYLAAMPQSPNYYSPYGSNKDKLEARKNLVLDQMAKNGFITTEIRDRAKKEKVVFYEKINQGIKAPHFVFWLKDYLDQHYGQENIETNNFKIITTIDWPLQQKVEELAKKYGAENEVKFKAQNNSVVVIDPKTGQILALTGSRDYFNQEIDGNFNVATAHRQPGSSFKPFVYATAFNKGYTDQTVVFDLKTEFNASCDPTGKPLVGTKASECYMPQNYDSQYLGPITLRDALAQSRNIPAIKVLYLTGINNALETARKMGISSLGTKNQYGLTLVLGGGEVSLLEMTGAYGIFAQDGVKHETTGILKMISPENEVLEEYQDKSGEVLPANSARLISDILSDDNARLPAYGPNSPLYFPGRQVAVKTGTTNDYKDVWILGYTPSIVIGAWSGNNDNTPMEKKVAGTIVSPMWHAIMAEALKTVPVENFIPPTVNYTGLKPVLRGFWQGSETRLVDLPATTNQISNKAEILKVNVHSILYWLNKDNPLGPAPFVPSADPQFRLWEYPIQKWFASNKLKNGQEITMTNLVEYNPNLINQINFSSPLAGASYKKDDLIRAVLVLPADLNLSRADYFVNENLVASVKSKPFVFSFRATDFNVATTGPNTLRVNLYDQTSQNFTKTTIFNLLEE